MKKLVILCVMGLFLLVGTNAFADVINLGTFTPSPYEYDSTAGTSTDVTRISFNYRASCKSAEHLVSKTCATGSEVAILGQKPVFRVVLS